MIEWKIVGVEADHITVEYPEDGETKRLNFNVRAQVDAIVNPQLKRAPGVGTQAGPGIRIAGTAYLFETGALLREHEHDERSAHDVQVLAGKVVVHKPSGDVTAAPGERVTIAVHELHSVEALEPSTTLHLLRSP